MRRVFFKGIPSLIEQSQFYANGVAMRMSNIERIFQTRFGTSVGSLYS